MTKRIGEFFGGRALAAALLLGVLALLASCSGAPKLRPDAATLGSIKRVAVLTIPEPGEYSIRAAGSPMLAFGLLGAAIAGMDQSMRSEQFTTALRGTGFRLSSEFTDRLVAALESAGYEVERTPNAGGVEGGKQLPDSPKVGVNAEAIFIVTPTVVGYIAPKLLATFRPALGARVEVAGADGTTVIFRESYMYGWNPGGRTTLLAASDSFCFAEFAQIMDGIATARQALETGADLVAQRIVRDFGKAR